MQFFIIPTNNLNYSFYSKQSRYPWQHRNSSVTRPWL